MIPRRLPRIPFPKTQIQKIESDVSSGVLSEEQGQKSIHALKMRCYNQDRVKQGEPDPKLAGAILDLVQGPGAVSVPKDTVGLHLDFASDQYYGHMGARKFAQLNLPRMQFYNPHLDIKVFRRPWMGRATQKTYPCAATIIKANGAIEVIEMRGKRSREIYKEVMSALRAESLSDKLAAAKEKGVSMAKPYSKWI